MTYPRPRWTCKPRRSARSHVRLLWVTHAPEARGYGPRMTNTQNEPAEPNANPAGDPGEVPGEEPGSPSDPQDFPETDPEAEPDDGNAEPGQMPESTDPIINA